MFKKKWLSYRVGFTSQSELNKLLLTGWKKTALQKATSVLEK